MATDQKINDLSNYSAPSSASDVLPIVDITTDSTKKITLTNLFAYLATFTQTLTNKTINASSNIITNVSLTTSVTGTLPVANGGTNSTDYRTATETFTNKRVTKRVVTVTQSATPTINTDNTDVAYITGLAQAVTSFTTNLSGTPVNGDTLIIDITDNGTGRALTFGSSFEASGNVALPTTTVASTKLTIGFRWNAVTSKWTCVAVA